MESFETLRPRLFAVAYKMTKSAADAEDIVQDLFLRFADQEAGIVQNAEAYWVKSTMNRCLDLLERKSRTAYVGVDLPEPLYSERFDEVRQLDVSYALLLLLQKLNPMERAVFILRETLDYGYGEIAGILGLQEANCRQVFHRAKEKMANDKIRHTPSQHERNQLMDAFILGAGGEVESLLSYLKDDIVIYSDGGGKVSAAVKPIIGSIAAKAFLQGLLQKFGHLFHVETALVNGETGIVFRREADGIVDSVLWADFDGEAVAAFYIIRNPDKLRGWK